MDFETVKNELLNIVSEIIEIDKSLLIGKEEVNIFEEFDVDSLLGLEIVSDIEKKFDIVIEDEEIDTLNSFNKILELVLGYLETITS